jgi:hypothetical protein
MAKAKLKTVKRTVVDSSEVKLTLSMDEAKAIQAVFALVGGSPSDSPRGMIENVSWALDPIVGFTTQCLEDFRNDYDVSGSIYFDDHE